MTETNNKVVATNITNKSYTTALTKAQYIYTNMITNAFQGLNIEYTNYQKVCVINAVTQMQTLAEKEGLSLSRMNQSNVINILQTIAMLNLNLSSSPRECYIITRNVQKKDGTWDKVFEMGIEGDGNDKILRQYGVNVKKVHNCWKVRENDEFTFPSFNGLEITPPTWSPKYTGKIIRIVYPIEMYDGTVEYHISEREEVKVNLLAHISNNLMKSKDYTEAKKAEIKNRLANLTLDKIFEDKDALAIMSPSWREQHSREAMIERKMRNNCIKKIPKDFSNAFIQKAYESTFEDYDQYREDERIDKESALEAEIETSANKEKIDIPQISQPAPEEKTEVVENVQAASEEVMPY